MSTSPSLFWVWGRLLGRDFEGLFRRDASVEQVAKTRNLFFSKKEKNLEAEREKKTSVPVRGGENKHLLSIFSIFLYPHTHRIPHSYFAHNGYFFRRQGTHATQFFSSRARLLFASEVPPAFSPDALFFSANHRKMDVCLKKRNFSLAKGSNRNDDKKIARATKARERILLRLSRARNFKRDK